jgi:hypothetical protein
MNIYLRIVSSVIKLVTIQILVAREIEGIPWALSSFKVVFGV